MSALGVESEMAVFRSPKKNRNINTMIFEDGLAARIEDNG